MRVSIPEQGAKQSSYCSKAYGILAFQGHMIGTEGVDCPRRSLDSGRSLVARPAKHASDYM